MKKFLLFYFISIYIIGVSGLWAQEKTVSGKVTSVDDGSPLPGVNVVVRGTTSGTVTNIDGEYTVSVPGNARVIVFSFIGMATEEIEVNSQTVINVRMSPDVEQLSEVVISGLASTIKRSNLANSVGFVSGEELMGSTTPQTVDAAIYGKFTGANIKSNGGAPGGGISVQLRGVSTISGSNEPLWIVDGVYVNNSQFDNGRGSASFNAAGGSLQSNPTNRVSDLDPSDIETMEVLKGSSAAAIYGARANNGVIIVTTKRGKEGKTSINFKQDIGFAERLTDLGQSGWTDEKIDLIYGAGSDRANLERQRLSDALSGSGLVDWEDELFGERGRLTNTKLSISGGTSKTQFFVSGGLLDEEGIVRNTGYQRNSIRANVNHKVSKAIDVAISTNYINSNNQRGWTSNSNNDVSLTYQYAYTPNYANFLRPDEFGNYPDSPYRGENPFAIIDKAVNDESTNRFITSASLNAFLLKKDNVSVKFAFQGGVDYLNTASFLYLPDDLQSQRSNANPGAARHTKSVNFNTNWQAFLLADWQLNKTGLTTQVGVTRLTTERDISWVQGTGLPAGDRNPRNGNNQSFDQTFVSWQDVGLVAQQEANYDDKLIGTLGVRLDKSNLNGDPDKFFAFPKASVALNLHEFDFFPSGIISQFKLRSAYGETGGVPAFGDIFTALITENFDGSLGVRASTLLGNSDIEPETAAELEFGFDVGLFNNRVNLEATYYNKEVRDLIRPFVLARSTGVVQVKAFPVGDMENRGLELALNANPVKTNRVSWNTRLQWWTNETEVTKSVIPVTNIGPAFGNSFGRNQFREGDSPTRFYGLPRIEDGPLAGELSPLEESQPDFQMSWLNSITFLNSFEFSMLWHWSEGNYNSNIFLLLMDEGGVSNDFGEDSDNNGTINSADREFSRDFIADASYFRLREVGLYYTMPKPLVNSILNGNLEKIRVGVSANNLLLISDYTDLYGWDPEVSTFSSRPVGGAIDLGSFPSSRRIFFHLEIGL
ncbi:SusC/RagA family TonB-linked outer membrane protein [Fulvivirga sp. M361]|uniref:SusC/RagA family TonB-linked outer membrane protein n=1 Tax=Fulvivirga sp. M361 TaxID=2594266 RepID=UPI00117BB2F7|nr:SusC/RagA family TonB-linked outer membrane protein [Fulvivirga sp. M361]TRX59944.1 SusC/RagA family TonB-linked outer membrane protein [Fulvivirga sp. M361]